MMVLKAFLYVRALEGDLALVYVPSPLGDQCLERRKYAKSIGLAG